MGNRNQSGERESFWRLALEEHAKSGLNTREFCRREALSEASFYSWRRKIRQRDSEADTCKLVPVKVVPGDGVRRQPANEPAVEKEPSVEIVAAGVVIRLNDIGSTDTVYRVLTAAQRLVKAASPC